MGKEEVKPKQISTGLVVTLGIIGIIIFILLLTVGWFIGTFNTLVKATQDINNQWSNIETEYQRRADLFYNMVEITKSYANFEKDTLTAVTQARSGAFANTKEEQMKQMNNLDSAFARLLAVFEQYPQLKANEQYTKLMNQVQVTEDRIQIARTDYNSLIRDYNTYVQKFPTRMLAQMYGYSDQKYFDSEKGTEYAPKLDMKLTK
jgi:LemA protein